MKLTDKQKQDIDEHMILRREDMYCESTYDTLINYEDKDHSINLEDVEDRFLELLLKYNYLDDKHKQELRKRKINKLYKKQSNKN